MIILNIYINFLWVLIILNFFNIFNFSKTVYIYIYIFDEYHIQQLEYLQVLRKLYQYFFNEIKQISKEKTYKKFRLKIVIGD